MFQFQGSSRYKLQKGVGGRSLEEKMYSELHGSEEMHYDSSYEFRPELHKCLLGPM